MNFHTKLTLQAAWYDIANSPNGPPESEIRRRAADKQHLAEVRGDLVAFCVTISNETRLFRVRRIPPTVCTGNRTWQCHEMRGNPSYPGFRANLPGDPIIYLADSPQTAFAEVGATPGEAYTVAEFTLGRSARLVDARTDAQGHPMQQWHRVIAGWLSTPVARADRAFGVTVQDAADPDHYYVTRYFSTLVRSEGYDGIAFSSSIHQGGYNIALYNPELAVCSDCVIASA